jgi:uncharacterized membrane protein YphA (DoxX/SURF4 family)
MTLTTLLITFAAVGAVFTFLMAMMNKGYKSLVMTFLQNFCGVWFIFSGIVKAIDPLGTAYKMEQYFAAFDTTAKPTPFSFLSPMFNYLSNYALYFAVAMIILEIVLGVMLILGDTSKTTVRLFWVLNVFFLLLTGFTFLTGYVPADANFFDFSKWGDFKETQMRVSDCGCFGDFLKLNPKVSFQKDIFLTVIATLFLFFHTYMHRLFTRGTRSMWTWGTMAATVLFCLNGYQWNLPMVDFRPFKEGTDIREIKKAEMEAASAVKVIGYNMINEKTGEKVVQPFANPDSLTKEIRIITEKFPTEKGWTYGEPLKTKSILEKTKISDFSMDNLAGVNMTDSILSYPTYQLMVTCKEIPHEVTEETQKIGDSTVIKNRYLWYAGYQKIFLETINPFIAAAAAKNIKTFAVTKPESNEAIEDFAKTVRANYPFYKADDILLKTIIRSNPGITLWKDGRIIKHWHYKQLPSFDVVNSMYIK